MNELWVARDFTGTWIGAGKPTLLESTSCWTFPGGVCRWIYDEWTDLRPGESRRLVMAEEQ